jgi:hypothetical protein
MTAAVMKRALPAPASYPQAYPDWDNVAAARAFAALISIAPINITRDPPEPLAESANWLRRFSRSKQESMFKAYIDGVFESNRYSCFVKVEKAVLTPDLGDLYDGNNFLGGPTVKHDPRCIMCPSEARRYRTGPFGRYVTHYLGYISHTWTIPSREQYLTKGKDVHERLYRLGISMFDLPTEPIRIIYPCGYNAEQLGELYDQHEDLILIFGDDNYTKFTVDDETIHVDADASRQDGRFTRALKEWTYDRYFNKPVSRTPLGDCISYVRGAALDIEGSTKDVAFKTSNLNPSGEATTAFLATNASGTKAYQIYLWAKKTQVFDVQVTLQFGSFPYKLKASRHAEKAEFLSMLWYPAICPSSRKRVTKPGPKPGRILARSFWHVGNYRPHKAHEHLKGLADCLWLSVSHIPILNDLITRIRVILDGVDGTRYADNEVRYKLRGTRPYLEHPGAEEFLARRYDVTIEEIQNLREMMREATLESVFDSPVLDRVLDMDL